MRGPNGLFAPPVMRPILPQTPGEIEDKPIFQNLAYLRGQIVFVVSNITA